jgi:hypothetical protein
MLAEFVLLNAKLITEERIGIVAVIAAGWTAMEQRLASRTKTLALFIFIALSYLMGY